MNEEYREWRLIAILPPGSMERVLADTARRLYTRCGMVSALALPPHIPLAFLRRSWSSVEFTRKLYAAVAPLRCTVQGYDRVRRGDDEFLYLAVQAARLEEVRRLVRENAADDLAPADEELYPTWPGIFLGVIDQGGDEPLPPPLPPGAGVENSFGTYYLSLLRVRCGVGAPSWWSLLSWEEVVTIPVGKLGPKAPAPRRSVR